MRAFDGTQGWTLRAALNVGRPDAQPFAAEELEFARAGQGIDGPLIDSAAEGNLVTLEGLARKVVPLLYRDYETYDGLTAPAVSRL